MTIILTPTKDLGARSVSVGLTEVPLEQTMPTIELEAFAPGAGLNSAFVADLFSAFLAHEQCGVHLYRTVAGLTANPMLERGYREFLAETEQHVAILEQLITRLGGDPLYVSPAARLVHAMDSHLMQGVVLAAGSADQLTCEMAMLEAVMLAETKCNGDWKNLAARGAELPKGEVRDAVMAAVDEVMPQEDEHVSWATDTWQRMTMMQAKSSTLMKIADFTEQTFARIRNAVS
jgi:hypothetical protein